MSTPDIMPTLLGALGLPIPRPVEGAVDLGRLKTTGEKTSVEIAKVG